MREPYCKGAGARRGWQVRGSGLKHGAARLAGGGDVGKSGGMGGFLVRGHLPRHPVKSSDDCPIARGKEELITQKRNDRKDAAFAAKPL